MGAWGPGIGLRHPQGDTPSSPLLQSWATRPEMSPKVLNRVPRKG